MQASLRIISVSLVSLFFAGFVFAQDKTADAVAEAKARGLGAIKSTKEKAPKSITLGVIPSDDPEKIKKTGLVLARYLSDRVGVTVNLYISKNYQGLIDAMKAKKVDYAFFTAMSFVFAEKQAGAKVLLKKVWANPFYYSVILTKKSSGITSLKDIKGKTFGFVDEKSTSGYLYPRVELKKQGLNLQSDFAKTQFFANHQETAHALLEGKADAVAVFADGADGSKSAVEKFYPGREKEVKALWVSPPIPNDPFVVRQDFYDRFPQLTHRVMFAFLDMQEDPKGNLLKDSLGVEGVMMATSRQYDPVREMVKELDLKLE